MHKFLWSALLLGVAAAPAAAQDLLPASFSGWSAAAEATRARPAGLDQFAGNDAAVLRECGILSAERQAYSRGSATLTVTLYRMRDTTAAYASYTYLLGDQMVPASLTRYSSLSSQRDLVLVRNLLLDVRGPDLRALTQDLQALVSYLHPKADGTPYPTLGEYLPAQGLIVNSERYLLGPTALSRLLPLGHGDWIGFNDGAEAEFARYRINGQEATLLLISYPTPQAATRKLEELRRWFPVNPDAAGPDSRPVLFAKRASSLLAVVTQTRSRAIADALLSKIEYQTQITWNEPSFRATEPTWGEFVAGAFIGTGLIMLFAVIAGIGFGGVRILVKYFFPGKVFDRAGRVEILQLGLSSKPIEAKDFY